MLLLVVFLNYTSCFSLPLHICIYSFCNTIKIQVTKLHTFWCLLQKTWHGGSFRNDASHRDTDSHSPEVDRNDCCCKVHSRRIHVPLKNLVTLYEITVSNKDRLKMCYISSPIAYTESHLSWVHALICQVLSWTTHLGVDTHGNEQPSLKFPPKQLQSAPSTVWAWENAN